MVTNSATGAAMWQSGAYAYDGSGNVTAIGGATYGYDAVSRLVSGTVFTGPLASGSFLGQGAVYTADDERLWTFHEGQNRSRWVVRDLDGKVLREFDHNWGTWTVARDYVHRDGVPLAAVQPAGQINHLHPDHLGTPRLITRNDGGGPFQVAFHAYYPYGVEATAFAQDDERMKFTGHERDLGVGWSPADDVDYMHARYYNPQVGRFLSTDPAMGTAQRPQSWNRYAYALNNPLKWVDPTGETVSLADLTDEERKQLLAKLNEFTGNTYGVNDSLELVLVEVGTSSSETATSFLSDAIADDREFQVKSVTGKNEGPDGEVRLNFSSFDNVRYGKVDPAAFNLGSTFVHELFHASTGIKDWDGYPGNVINLSDFTWRGPAVEFVNQIRAERGLPQRAGYLSPMGMSGRSKIPFDHVNPQKPEKVYYVRRGAYWK